MKYGYERCSTEKQDLIRQEYALKNYNLDKVFSEHISGTKKCTSRPEFEKLLNELNEGDEVYFESMSRMARSMQDLIDTTNLLANKKHCTVHFIKENIVAGGGGMSAMTSLLFHIMGAFAQFERDLIADRTKQALQAKKEQGVVLGRPMTEQSIQEYERIREMINNGFTNKQIIAESNFGKTRTYEIIKEIKGE